MRAFAIQAVCDETVVWDVLTLLEQHRCLNILARPVGPDTTVATLANDTENRIEFARRYAKEHGRFRSRELQDALTAAGYPGRPYGIVFTLKQRGELRRVGTGRYQWKGNV